MTRNLRSAVRVALRFAAAKTWKIDRAAVNRKLKLLNDPDAQKDSMATLGGYTKVRYELVPIAKINLPPVWHPVRPGPLRERMEKDLPIDPVRLSESGGRFSITDGIHRTNVAKEFGFTHVPAFIDEWVDTPDALQQAEPQKPQLELGAWVKLPKPDGGRQFGWVDEQLGFRADRGVKRWFYSIALVKPGDDFPDFVDLRDTEFEPTSPPSWGPEIQSAVKG